jgi:hypothetical protein
MNTAWKDRFGSFIFFSCIDRADLPLRKIDQEILGFAAQNTNITLRLNPAASGLEK